jgi:hypothetical protein
VIDQRSGQSPGVLIRKRVIDRGRRLAAPGRSRVLRTMQIVGVDTVIDCRDSLSHALSI